MSADRTALLFCPPLAPVEVPRNGRVSIGRGRDCDFAVCTDDASRRHAEVYADDGLFIVRDLMSRNGTFVNGELIGGPRRLEPGDRIAVGSAAITFCLVQSSLDGFLSDPAGQETALFTEKRAGEAFAARGARLLTDAALTRGGCRVESDLGSIAASVESRWAQANPAGPPPTTATFLPVAFARVKGCFSSAINSSVA